MRGPRQHPYKNEMTHPISTKQTLPNKQAKENIFSASGRGNSCFTAEAAAPCGIGLLLRGQGKGAVRRLFTAGTPALTWYTGGAENGARAGAVADVVLVVPPTSASCPSSEPSPPPSTSNPAGNRKVGSRASQA